MQTGTRDYYGVNQFWTPPNIAITKSLVSDAMRNINITGEVSGDMFSINADNEIEPIDDLTIRTSEMKVTTVDEEDDDSVANIGYLNSTYETISSYNADKQTLQNQITSITNNYLTQSSAASTYETITAHNADKATLQTAINAKADSADVYTKTQTDSLLAAKASASDVTTLISAVSNKANASDVYTKTVSDSKYETITAHETDIERLEDDIAAKANAADVYTKTETDNTFLTQSSAASTYQPKLTDSYIKVLRYELIGHFDTATSSNVVFKEDPTSICQIWLDYSNFTVPSSDDIFEIWIRGTLKVSSSTTSLPETFVGKGDGVAGMTSLIFKINSSLGIPLNWAVRTFAGGVITIDINTTAKLLATDIIPSTGGTSRYGFIYYYSANYTKYALTFTQQYDVYATHYRMGSAD